MTLTSTVHQTDPGETERALGALRRDIERLHAELSQLDQQLVVVADRPSGPTFARRTEDLARQVTEELLRAGRADIGAALAAAERSARHRVSSAETHAREMVQAARLDLVGALMARDEPEPVAERAPELPAPGGPRPVTAVDHAISRAIERAFEGTFPEPGGADDVDAFPEPLIVGPAPSREAVPEMTRQVEYAPADGERVIAAPAPDPAGRSAAVDGATVEAFWAESETTTSSRLRRWARPAELGVHMVILLVLIVIALTSIG